MSRSVNLLFDAAVIVNSRSVEILTVLPLLSIHFEEILSRAHGSFEEPNKFLLSSAININYSIILLKHILIIQIILIIIVFQIKD